MLVLFVGDVVGEPGRRILGRALPVLCSRFDVDFVVVNGENAAAGRGLTPAHADAMFAAGADVITTGNHVWGRKSIRAYIARNDRLLRPANWSEPVPGQGVCVARSRQGEPVAVVSMLGRVFMNPADNPFHTMDKILADLGAKTRTILVDFHAEATSEKVAMGWYLDGRVSAVLGTHTHVPTADEHLLPGGTAYITDAGMTGPHDSVIGSDKDGVLKAFLEQGSLTLAPAEGDVRLSGVLLEVDSDGRAVSIRRIRLDECDLGEDA